MSYKIVYQYDKDTKELVGEIRVQESPLEPGIFLCPDNTIDVKPISTEEKNKIIIFNEQLQNWEIVDDYRNVKIIKKDKSEIIEIKEIGKSIIDYPDYDIHNSELDYSILKYDLLNKEWIEDIDVIKNIKKNEIVSSFETEFQNGHFPSTSLGIEVDCRRTMTKNDKQNVEGLISNMTRKGKSKINYVGYSEICPNVTKEMLTNLVGEMEDYVLGLYEKKWILQTQIENTSNIEEVKNIKW
jgi:hypothetical protein